MSPAKSPEHVDRGWIVPIGGAEEKVRDAAILSRFLELSGRASARLAIIPTASRLADTGERYEQIFKELGAKEAIALPYTSRADADRDDWLEVLERSTGIFFTGGNQLRISTILGGTRVAKAVRRLNAHGVTVGGTSAGAAVLSEHMIAYGKTGATPLAGMTRLAPGLGLTNRFVIDQHFRQRDRLGRLLSALGFNPFAVGIGLDEDTGAFIAPDDSIEVVGSGAVTVVDVSTLTHSSIASAREDEPVCMTNVTLHVLPEGSTFNPHTRLVVPPGPRLSEPPDSEP